MNIKNKLSLWAALIVVPLAYAFGEAAWTGTKAGGYYLTSSATQKWASHGATPTVQSAATVTAFAALQAKGIIATGQDYSLKHKTVSLTAANIIAMYAAPVVLIDSPGSGKSIVVQRAVVTMTRTSTAFTGGGVVILQYGSTANGAGTQSVDSTVAAAVVTGAAGTTVTARTGAVISDLAATSSRDTALYVSNATAAFAAGTGTATVDLWYYEY
jgi:hypothetical protein